MSTEAMKLAPAEIKIGNYNSAAERLEAALAQPQQEPVQVLQPAALVTSLVVGPDGVVRAGLDRELPLMTEVYTQQPQRQLLTNKEVAYILAQLPVPPVNDGKALHDWAMQAVRELAIVNMDKAPPARKPLTIDEINDLAMQSGAFDEQLLAFARAIEAAHNIKEST